ncbi:MAG: sugar ABC transporter permease [Microbacteriaceae bacterium]|nr:sugar ABC transporter permease [Microbacteriaceae bacterium]
MTLPAGTTSTRAVGSADREERRAPARTLNRVAFILIFPAVALVGLFFVVPIVQAVTVSLSGWPGVGPVEIEGLGNYAAVLASPEFYHSLLRTVVFAVVVAFGIVSIATLLAAAVSRRVRGARIYRVIWFIPGIAPAAAVAVYWNTAFQPEIGTVNAIAGLLGLNTNSALLASPSTALYPVILVSIWSGVGFAFILILGGMEQIPVSVYEAASIDGASPARQFFSLTLPLLRPILSITATLNLIWAFNNFTTVWGMTNGGPGLATTTLPVLVYRTAFIDGQFGEGSAIAVIAGAILLVLGFVSLRITQSRGVS